MNINKNTTANQLNQNENKNKKNQLNQAADCGGIVALFYILFSVKCILFFETNVINRCFYMVC